MSAAKDEDKEDGEISTDDAAAEIRQKKIEDRDAAAAELKVLGTVFLFSPMCPHLSCLPGAMHGLLPQSYAFKGGCITCRC